MMTRRGFLAMAMATASAAHADLPLMTNVHRSPKILLRSSWQTVNIGDIGHTPGVLALLERHVPEAEVQLWPGSVDNGVREMLQQRFRKLTILGQGDIPKAFETCDFLLHGSGPSLVGQQQLDQWDQQTGKPFGVYGITLGIVDESTRRLLNKAKFVYFRDSVSLKVAQDAGINCPVMEFGPDGAFAVDLRNDAAATSFLADHQLEPGKFLCCIPRLRNTPYWDIKPGRSFDEKKHARNEAMKEHDNAPLRAAIIAVVRDTGLKVLLCPEDRSQMAVGKEMLYDKLPEDVKPRVVWREQYWLTDEALSTYIRSAGLFGLEMHSPIMCIGNGIPAIVARFAEQTSKGIMWRDIGLGDWLFDFDREEEIQRFVPAVLDMAQHPSAAQEKAAKARDFVRQLQTQSMAVLKRNL